MRKDIVSQILMAVIALLILINIYITLNNNGVVELKINKSIADIQRSVDAIKQPKDGIDGHSPIKGVDYFDGVDGTDGKDSVSTHTVETKTVLENIIKEVPVNGKDGTNGLDGKTPELRCNDVKNRWEVRYIGDIGWIVLKNSSDSTPVKCVINKGENL